MTDNLNELPSAIRDVPPCKGCTERFTACHDRCQKDARGEFGYKAWKAKIASVKKARREYAELTGQEYKRRCVNGRRGDY